MITTAMRRLQFCAGHRVMGHENKCSHVHGHNYVLMIYAASKTGLDDKGRVIDFSVLKEKMGCWIDAYWDHGFIININDKALIRSLKATQGCAGDDSTQKLYILTYNPTAENMAQYLISKVCPELFKNTGIIITKIELWETENCKAEVTLCKHGHEDLDPAI